MKAKVPSRRQQDNEAYRQRIEAEEHELVEGLRSAIQWLGSQQPQGALVNHLGIYMKKKFADSFCISLCPRGHDGLPVIIFNKRDCRWEGGRQVETITQEHVQQALKIVRQAAQLEGNDVKTSWNGVGCDSFSIELLKPAGPGVMALLGIYHKGCPDHTDESVFCRCGWFQKAYAKAKLPEGWV